MNFADPGVWVWQVVNCDYNRIKAIADAGFRWIAIQICSGQQAVRTGNYKDLIDSARSLGLDVAGFGWCVDSPVEEAETADRLLEAWKLDGFIANGEQPLNYTQNGGACPDCFNYSSQWTARWKELRGTVGMPSLQLPAGLLLLRRLLPPRHPLRPLDRGRGGGDAAGLLERVRLGDTERGRRGGARRASSPGTAHPTAGPATGSTSPSPTTSPGPTRSPPPSSTPRAS